jgi:DNA-binding MarR family transcriptional regulator
MKKTLKVNEREAKVMECIYNRDFPTQKGIQEMFVKFFIQTINIENDFGASVSLEISNLVGKGLIQFNGNNHDWISLTQEGRQLYFSK